MILRELITKLSYSVDSGGLNTYRNQIIGTANDIKRIGKQMQMAGVQMSLAVTTPLVIAGKKMISSASDAQEVKSKYAQVFRDMREESELTAKQLAEDFDLASSTSKELLGNTGDLLTGFGYSQEEALKMSNQVNRLAGDLNSFQNIQGGTAEASKRLLSGMVGNTEALNSMGIVIRQDGPDFKKRVENIMALTGVTIQQAKAQAILEEAMRQSKNAVGDYARTRGEHANVEKAYEEARKEFWESFGEVMLPVATKVIKALTDITKWFTNLSTGQKKAILVFGALLASIGPVLIALGTLLQTLGSIALIIGNWGAITASVTAFFTALKVGAVAVAPLLAPMLLVLAKIGAVIGVIYLAYDDIKTWMGGGDSLIGAMLGDYKSAMQAYKNAWVEVKEFVVALFKGDWDSVWGQIKQKTEDVEGALVTLKGGDFAQYKQDVKDLGKWQAFSNLVGGVQGYDEKRGAFRDEGGKYVKIGKAEVKIDISGLDNPSAVADAVASKLEESLVNTARMNGTEDASVFEAEASLFAGEN